MSVLCDSAIDAFETAARQRLGEARTVLAAVLAPFDVESLEVAYFYESGDITVYIFGDGATFLSSRTDGVKWWVDLVNNDHGWTKQVGPIKSLVHLGEVLAGLPVPDPDPVEPQYPEWFQRYSPDGWAEGAIVRFEGSLWRSNRADNVWTPGQFGWEPVVEP